MTNNPSKDHYIPQLYLDAFAMEGSGLKNPHIYQYMDNEVVKPRIKDIASEKNFYTFKDKLTGKSTRIIDNLLTQIESNASSPLKKIINTENINLTNEELEHLSIFFATLAVRTPGFIKSQESLQEEALKEFQAVQAMDINQLKKICEDTGQILNDQELKDLQEFIIGKEYSINFTNSNDYFIGQGLKLSMGLSEMYYKKRWHLLINNTSEPFITSDNPISIYRPIYLPPVYNAGYGNGTLIIPISPKLSLLLRDFPLKKNSIKINSYFVKKINKNIIRFSNNYIYSNQENKRIRTLFKITERKVFQKIKVTRMGWAPFTFMGPLPVPEEIIK